MKGTRTLLLGLVTLMPLLLQGEAWHANSTDVNDHNARLSRISAEAYALPAQREFNPLTQQLPLPTKAGEVFIVDDFNNKVIKTNLGSNYFMGNTGVTEDPEGTTTISLSEESSGSSGGSLQISYTFTGPAVEGPFAGYFASLFGLTDTKVSLDGSGQEPPQTTPFPGYFLDLLDVYRDIGLWPDRSVDQLKFDVRLLSAEPIDLKIELTEEKDDPLDMEEIPRRVYARRAVDTDEWQTISLTLPGESGVGDFTGGDTGSFNPHRVSLLSLIVERLHIGDGVENPDTGTFLVDNMRLIDTDGDYPNLDAIEAVDGTLLPEYEDAFLDLVRATSFLHFLDFASTDPRTGASTDYLRGGIIQDRSTFADLMSVGGVGFQLTSYVIGAERGYISRDDAAVQTHSILQVLHDYPQGSDRVHTIGYKGFFYHFLGIDGLRKQNFDFNDTEGTDESLCTVELSTIDTALALAGVITARQYFDDVEDSTEAEIRSMADELYDRVDWNFMLEPTSDQFYLGWKPNETRDDTSGRCGRFLIDDDDVPPQGQYSSKLVGGEEAPATIDYYTDEGLLVALLAIASPNPEHRVDEDVFYSMIREDQGASFVKTYPGSLFTYQFGSVWLDTQALGSDAHPERPMDYFENTRDAILATRQYAIDNPNDRATLNADRWGLSATEGPFGDYFAEAAPPAAIATTGQCLGSGGPLALEAEDGIGDGIPKFRSEASGGQTVLLHDGESHTMSFDLQGTALYEVDVRYSNDNYGPLETVEVSIDETIVGQFEAQDTGDYGQGWNVFEWSGPIGSHIVAPGSHGLPVSVTGGDGYGVEIDLVSLAPIPVKRDLEVGTVTVYGVGSSIVHTPDEAVAALWEAQSLGLFHPRFGFADAFNLEIADTVIPGCVDPDDPGVLRTSGPWEHFVGFGIDHGPMLILIDNYLADQFTPTLLMAYPTINEALARLFPTLDSDGDGFTDGVEQFLGTDPLDDCTNDPGVHDAWPLDNDVDGEISVTGDVFNYVGRIGAMPGSPEWWQRLDLDMSGDISVTGDVFMYRGRIGETCT